MTTTPTPAAPRRDLIPAGLARWPWFDPYAVERQANKMAEGRDRRS